MKSAQVVVESRTEESLGFAFEIRPSLLLCHADDNLHPNRLGKYHPVSIVCFRAVGQSIDIEGRKAAHEVLEMPALASADHDCPAGVGAFASFGCGDGEEAISGEYPHCDLESYSSYRQDTRFPRESGSPSILVLLRRERAGEGVRDVREEEPGAVRVSWVAQMFREIGFRFKRFEGETVLAGSDFGGIGRLVLLPPFQF
jgi:hypothetical protein